MEIRQLVTFVNIIEQQSFSKAAAVLGYTQAAVTIQIQQLEQEFHTKFFSRVGRRIDLTPQGREFEKYAREILRTSDNAYKAISGRVFRSYSLHIGTLNSLLAVRIPQLVRHFYIHSPETHLKITAGLPRELTEMLNHNQLDMIYLLDNPISNPAWVKVLEAPEEIVFVASTHSYLARASSVPLKELTALPLFLTEQHTNYRQMLDQMFIERGLEVRPFFETGNTDVIIRLIQANQGVSFLPRLAVEESVRNGKLAVINVEDISLKMYRQLFYHRNKWVTEEMKEVIRFGRTLMDRPANVK
ncbi:MAG: LysR family transcriptional regulator [Lachnospiraceae bacterium]|nr:LysR family transcriptional regulator [Lachnospiraceae bacterium]